MVTLSTRFLLVAVVCALTGMSAGVGMAIAQDFALAPAHAHLNLLGWVSMALYGLFYRVEPRAALGRLPQVHFWLATLGVAVMIPGVTWRLLGHPEAEAVIGPGALMVIAAMVVFGVVVFRHRAGDASVRGVAPRDAITEMSHAD
jgi:hypothetical protein